MSGATIEVASHAELLDALTKATGGETILLAGGDYGTLALNGKTGQFNYDTSVALRLQDDADPAVLSGLSLTDIHNLTLDGIDLDYDFAPGDRLTETPFRINGGGNIKIHNAEITGDVAQGLDALSDGYPSGYGLFVSGTEGVELVGSTISAFMRGAVFKDSDDVVVRGNELYGLRSDGLDFAGVQNVVIEDNYLHDLNGVEASLDHRDMIQFWTSSTDRPSTDIVIRGNLIDAGEGTPTQSIFMRNELVDLGQAGEEMFYRNVLIEENVIIGKHEHGIVVGEALGVEIANNTVLRKVSDRPENVNTPLITVAAAAQDVTIHHNVAGGINGPAAQTDWAVSDNLIVQDRDQFADDHYTAHFLNPTPGARSDLSNLIVRPDSIIAAEGMGATRLLYDDQPDTFTPLIVSTQEAGNQAGFTFDASLTAGPGGPIGTDAVIRWIFSDGTEDTGQVVNHTFTQPGRYDVTMEVTDTDGTVHRKTVHVEVTTPAVLRFDTETGEMIGYDTGIAVAMDTLAAETADGHVIRLHDAESSVEVDQARLDGFFGASDFRLALDFSSELGEAAAGALARLHNAVVLRLLPDTSLWALVTNSDGVSFKLTTDPLGSDALAAGISTELAFDGAAGTLALYVNGQSMAQTAAWGTTPDLGYWGFILGAAYNHPGAVGEISRLELTANAQLHGFATATTDTTAAAAATDVLTDVFILPDAVNTGDLEGDAYVDELDGNLVLDGDGDRLDIGRLETFEEANALSVEISFTRSGTADGYERLLWNHRKIGVELYKDNLVLRLATAEDGFQRLWLRDLGIDDTERHDLTIHADGDRDHVEVILDGETIMARDDLDLQFADAGGHEWGWWLGAAFGRYFDGEVHDLEIASLAEDFVFDSTPPDDGLLSA